MPWRFDSLAAAARGRRETHGVASTNKGDWAMGLAAGSRDGNMTVSDPYCVLRGQPDNLSALEVERGGSSVGAWKVLPDCLDRSGCPYV